MARGVEEHGLQTIQLPLADGGEGLVDVFGGSNRESLVSGPLGGKVRAVWRLDQSRAVIEMASASGLTLVGGATKNDPMRASSVGTGELILAAIEAGATQIIVGAGGSASTDGGLSALELLRHYAPLNGHKGHKGHKDVEVLVASDVQTLFLDAAKIFGAQKGATPNQIKDLTALLETLREKYRREFGIDVSTIAGSGAAGGFAGGMAALGAKIVNGFNLVADELHLDKFLEECDIVLTGEGSFDQSSFEGKVVGSLLARAAALGKPCAVIAGRVAENVIGDFDTLSLVEKYGATQAMTEARKLVENASYELMKNFLTRKSARDEGENG